MFFFLIIKLDFFFNKKYSANLTQLPTGKILGCFLLNSNLTISLGNRKIYK
ncbi:hypothetical protein HMPREF0204_15056 [Chryseobacterium gleum ATCC 35910]|uniref:Uncharacterized protein n=1 Tax=Chryseobacterium gleum ATCC 35910 TaxID=525257 RepID=A0ABN0ASB2_CHRGE|nr:hypothetical protein HMPREF0204_15056 [Chryseobacterium gleum ATCC 35910]